MEPQTSFGIDTVGNITWGSHLCQFYQSRKDLLDVLIPFFKTGLDNNEFCIWIAADPLDARSAEYEMAKALPDLSTFLRSGQLQILPYQAWYLRNGSGDFTNLMSRWVQKFHDAEKRGFAGVRATRDVSCLQKSCWQNLIEYETTINSELSKYRTIALCSYSLRRCAANEVFEVIDSHTSLLTKSSGVWHCVPPKNSSSEMESIIENSDDAIIRKTLDGTIVSWSKGAEKIYGYTSTEAEGRHISLLCPPENANELLNILNRIKNGDRIDHLETKRLRKDGKEVEVSLTISPLKNLAGEITGASTTVRDISERRLAGEALSASEIRYRTLVESMSEGLLQVNNEDVIEYVNNRFCQMTGYAREELLNRVAHTLLMRKEDHALIRRKNDLRSRGISDKYEILMRTKEGKCKWVEIAGAPVRNTDGDFIGSIAVFTDITERKGAEEERQRLVEQLNQNHKQLTSVSRQLVMVEESQKRHIARELHDEIGQLLTGVKIKIDMSVAAARDGIRQNLSEASDLVNELMIQVRELSLSLRPPILDEFGLLPAVAWRLQRFISQTALPVDFEHSQIEGHRFGVEIETAVYRILQEALTNIIRHAGSCEVKVKLWATTDTLNLRIQDDGAGFSPGQGEVTFGLSGMRERAQLLGGSFIIETCPGKGTCLNLKLPL